MLLSHHHRFIYTKTLKTAGTSVEIYFEDGCISPGTSTIRGHHTKEIATPAGVVGYRGPAPKDHMWYNHMPASEIRELIGHAIWNEYYKFCVIRNPFDKLVSSWWFTVNSNQEYPHKDGDFSKIKSDFSRWCVHHAQDVVDRDKYMIDGQVVMDFFIRYELLLAGLEHVCRHVGYPFQPERLGSYKSVSRASRQRFNDYYDAPAVVAVEAAFGWELDYFGYGRPSETIAIPAPIV